MEAPENQSSQEISEFLRGLEPTMVANLRESQRKLKDRGIEMTLEEVYNFEVEEPEEEDS
jgi:hypothetical protein